MPITLCPGSRWSPPSGIRFAHMNPQECQAAIFPTVTVSAYDTNCASPRMTASHSCPFLSPPSSAETGTRHQCFALKASRDATGPPFTLSPVASRTADFRTCWPLCPALSRAPPKVAPTMGNAAGGSEHAVSPALVSPPWNPPFRGAPFQKGIPPGGETHPGGHSTAFFVFYVGRPSGVRNHSAAQRPPNPPAWGAGSGCERHACSAHVRIPPRNRLRRSRLLTIPAAPPPSRSPGCAFAPCASLRAQKPSLPYRKEI